MKRESLGKWVLSMLLWVWTGGLYFMIEVAWKTFQDKPATISWTMFVLAILLAIPLERFGAELPWYMPLFIQAMICATAITVMEFITGYILNIRMGLGIWDYSHLPGNILGQICLPFCIVWFIASALGIVMLDWMRYAVEGGERPRYTF